MTRHDHRSAGPSQRQLRAGELIRHALAEIFARETFRDPALANVSVTVSEVRTSPDLKAATVFCAPLGAGLAPASEKKSAPVAPDDVVDALNRLSPHIRTLLGRRVELKFTPTLSFRRDESFDEAERIDALLATPEVARDLK